MKAQDTAELFFDEVRVPGEQPASGRRAAASCTSWRRCRRSACRSRRSRSRRRGAVFDLTLAYCKERQAFGKPIGRFQHNRFVLAELATEIEIAETYFEKAVLEHNAGHFTVQDAAMAKWWTTELQKQVVDTCVQLHGGYGYMREYPVAKAWMDSRVQTIYGGTTEIMKEIIGRSLGV